MNKFVKGFLSLLVNGATFTLYMLLLPGIGADKSDLCCNIFIYLQWLIRNAGTMKCVNFVFVETEIFCPIRKKNTIYKHLFLVFTTVFLFTYKPIDLKMVILFWFRFLLACVAGAKRGGRGGGRKALSPTPFRRLLHRLAFFKNFRLLGRERGREKSTIPYPLSTPATQASFL